MKYQIQLIVNGTATGEPVGPAYPGRYLCRMQATSWNGATAKLQLEDPAEAGYLDILDGNSTTNSMFIVELPGEIPVRAAVTGGPPAGLYVFLDRLEV